MRTRSDSDEDLRILSDPTTTTTTMATTMMMVMSSTSGELRTTKTSNESTSARPPRSDNDEDLDADADGGGYEDDGDVVVGEDNDDATCDEEDEDDSRSSSPQHRDNNAANTDDDDEMEDRKCSSGPDDVDDSSSTEATVERSGDGRDGRRPSDSMDAISCSDNDDDVDFEAILSKPIVRFKLSLFEAPEFVERLRGYSETSVGQLVTFVAQYKAFPAPTVKWFKDEEEVRPTERHLLDSTEEGVIRLVISDVRPSDEGAYKCKVENQEGVASTTGYLSVLGGTSKAGRGLPTRSGKLSLNAAAGGQCRTSGVSTPPILRPIAEQKSMEEREELELRRQPPSPLQAFIDSIRHSTKSMHPPIFYGIEDYFDEPDDGAVDLGNSDLDEEDVFSGDDEAVSMTTSSESLEMATTTGDEDTEDDDDDDETVTRVIDDRRRHCLATSLCFDEHDDNNEDHLLDVKSSASASVDRLSDCPTASSAFGDSVVRSSMSWVADVPDGRISSSTLSSTADSSEPTWRSSFLQRRLGRLQLQHRLAVDLPEYSPTSPVSSNQNYPIHHHQQQLPAVALSAVPSRPVVVVARPSSSVVSPSSSSHEDVLRVVQDVVLTALDNPVVRFYAVFVAVSAAIANAFEVHPSWLILVVALASIVSFHVFGRQLTRT